MNRWKICLNKCNICCNKCIEGDKNDYKNQSKQGIMQMCFPSHYCACTYHRPTTTSCPLNLLIGPSSEIHQGVPMMGTRDCSMKARRVNLEIH